MLQNFIIIIIIAINIGYCLYHCSDTSKLIILLPFHPIHIPVHYTSYDPIPLGQRFNKDGILTQWWTNASQNAFNQRKECFVRQYSGYELQGQMV